MLLVTLVLWLFLGHARAALITALNIPLALLIAVHRHGRHAARRPT